MALNSCGVTITLGSNGIAGINNVGFDTSLDMLDVTDFDSNCEKQFIPGLSGATMTVAGDYLPADTQQSALVNAWKNKTKLETTTQPQFTVDGTHGFGADAYISSLSISTTVEGKVVMNASLQCTGEVSILV